MKNWAAFIRLARPHQYLKNGFIFLPLFFSYQFTHWQLLLRVTLSFLVFCLAASSVYVLNDLKDIQDDRLHPVKKNRPLASGAISVTEAGFFWILLALSSLMLTLIFPDFSVLMLTAGYIGMNIAYSFSLKHIPIVDVVTIASGFVLRVCVGGRAAGIPVSHWIVLMTFLLALFLALAKRRDDLLLAVDGKHLRRSLNGYTMEYVSLSMGVMAAVTIVSYILYTLSPEVIIKHGSDKLYLTTFWVIVGLLRYLQITVVKNFSGSPTRALIQDVFLQIVIAGWIANFVLLLYINR
ncbi:MAG: decaprenyl-phosphate phosphoribosyltransferase [Deltaproteobacteria bacterium]|nr:decaprenyl-phosphate phosphoribosyltransferase [Deltaproteobacteria bacterium]